MLNKKEERYIENELQQITSYLRRDSGGPGLNQFSELTKHIYVSSWVGASNREALTDYRINRIICLSAEKKPRSLMDTYQINHIDHKVLPLIDSPDENISKYLELVYDAIHQSVMNDENILVHCHAGSSLSAAFVIYYYLKRFYMTNFGKDIAEDFALVDPANFNLINIIKFVKEYRSCIEPNAEFIHQLLIAETFIKRRLKEFLDKQLEAEKKYKRERAIKEAEKRKKEREREKIPKKKSSKKIESSESEGEDLDNFSDEFSDEFSESEEFSSGE